MQKKVSLSLLSVSCAIIILGVIWGSLVFNMKNKIETFFKETSTQNQVLSYKKINIKQFFPMLVLKISDFSFVENNLFSLKIPELYISLFPLYPHMASLSTHHAEFHHLKHNLSFAVNSPTLNVHLVSPEEQSSFSFKSLDMTHNDNHLAHLDDLDFSIATRTMIANNDQGQYKIPGFDIKSSLKTLILYQSIEGLESSIQNISLSGFIMEKFNFEDLFQKPLKDIMREWRDRGGACEIEKTTFSWGPLTINIDGTIAFDQTLNPEGSFTLHIKGISDFLKHLAKARTYSNQDQLLLQLSLGFLSGPKGDLTLPLTILNQTLRLGNFVQISIPSLNW